MTWTLRYLKGFVFALAFVSALASLSAAQKPRVSCDSKVTKEPSSYTRGSELYYLSWVEHGNYAEKGASARKLLEMNGKTNLEVAEKVAACQQIQVFRNMMTLVLFDLAADKYLKHTKILLDEDDREMNTDLEGTWVKTEREFEGEIVDFYFDWGSEAAVRLLSAGIYSKRGKDILIEQAHSYYLASRVKARKVFDLFEGIPNVDLTVQRKRFDEASPVADQLKVIDRWFDANSKVFRWNSERRKYSIIQ
ncbi:MAG: hypothetical protein JNL64_12690 [Blastocatellia bacterium]|nr:hypothetical protein [Blastocatellia bacterium]